MSDTNLPAHIFCTRCWQLRWHVSGWDCRSLHQAIAWLLVNWVSILWYHRITHCVSDTNPLASQFLHGVDSWINCVVTPLAEIFELPYIIPFSESIVFRELDINLILLNHGIPHRLSDSNLLALQFLNGVDSRIKCAVTFLAQNRIR